jgi:hypothetical protein
MQIVPVITMTRTAQISLGVALVLLLFCLGVSLYIAAVRLRGGWDAETQRKWAVVSLLVSCLTILLSGVVLQIVLV